MKTVTRKVNARTALLSLYLSQNTDKKIPMGMNKRILRQVLPKSAAMGTNGTRLAVKSICISYREGNPTSARTAVRYSANSIYEHIFSILKEIYLP